MLCVTCAPPPLPPFGRPRPNEELEEIDAFEFPDIDIGGSSITPTPILAAPTPVLDKPSCSMSPETPGKEAPFCFDLGSSNFMGTHYQINTLFKCPLL